MCFYVVLVANCVKFNIGFGPLIVNVGSTEVCLCLVLFSTATQ